MKTKEILSIAALVAIALCLICGVAKTTIKSPKQKQTCDTACALLIFVAVILVGISQLLGEIGTPQVSGHVVSGQGFGGKGEPCHPAPKGMLGKPHCDSGYVCTPTPGTGPSLCTSNTVIRPKKPAQLGKLCNSYDGCLDGGKCGVANGVGLPVCIAPGQRGGICQWGSSGNSDALVQDKCSGNLMCGTNKTCQRLSFKRSFSCEGGRCVLQHVAPDESKGYYGTMAECQAKCKA
jgi:hypothetical protein